MLMTSIVPQPRRPGESWLFAACLSLLAIALLALPVGAAPRYRTVAPALSGELRIAGSTAMRDPVSHWVAIFHREQPGVRVHLSLSGAGTAAGAMAEGRADVAPMTRPWRLHERHWLAATRTVPRVVRLGTARAERIGTSAPHDDVALYLYLNRAQGGLPSAAAIEFARVAGSAEGMDHTSRTLFASLADRFARRVFA